MSHSEYSFGSGSYSSAEKQSMYSTDPADWAVVVVQTQLLEHSKNKDKQKNKIMND